MIKDLNDLSKLIKLCRKTGIQSIRIDGIEFHLGAEPAVIKKPKAYIMPVFAPGGITDNTEITSDQPSEEDLLFWSAGEQA